MNRIIISKGSIDFNFTDNNVIKSIAVDKTTQSQLISGRLAIARLSTENSSVVEYALSLRRLLRIKSHSVMRSIVLNNALAQDERMKTTRMLILKSRMI